MNNILQADTRRILQKNQLKKLGSRYEDSSLGVHLLETTYLSSDATRDEMRIPSRYEAMINQRDNVEK